MAKATFSMRKPISVVLFGFTMVIIGFWLMGEFVWVTRSTVFVMMIVWALGIASEWILFEVTLS